jgi:polysaccharide export outer membrane protein
MNRFLFYFILFCSLTGCLSYRDIVNFQDEQNKLLLAGDSMIAYQSIRLQPEDILQVLISSYNKEEASKFNLTVNPAGVGQNANTGASVFDPVGYRVDKNGNIEIPVIGVIRVAGLTPEEAKELIYEKIKSANYFKDFNVHVRFLSFRVTVLGEVNSPGTYTIPSQKLTILEALGLARDVSLFSKRNDILVIREQNGKRIFGHLDLNSKNIFSSPWYYLQPNDVVYVQPHRAKILAAPDPASRYVSTAIALVSLVLLFLRL